MRGMLFHYAHRKTLKIADKDVWNFPLMREIPYIKKSSSTLPKARVSNMQRACANKSTGFGITWLKLALVYDCIALRGYDRRGCAW
jgi:hypothetical protein